MGLRRVYGQVEELCRAAVGFGDTAPLTGMQMIPILGGREPINMPYFVVFSGHEALYRD